MKATGIIRRIDDLGRIVIPKEIRKTMHIRESDPLEIFTERDGDIILKKYSPIGELGNSAQLYAESIATQIPHTICICDQDCVIAAAGPNAKKLIGKLLDEKAEEALIDRKHILMDREKEDFFPLILDFPEVFRYVCLSTIIAESEAVGFVCILSIEDKIAPIISNKSIKSIRINILEIRPDIIKSITFPNMYGVMLPIAVPNKINILNPINS